MEITQSSKNCAFEYKNKYLIALIKTNSVWSASWKMEWHSSVNVDSANSEIFEVKKRHEFPCQRTIDLTIQQKYYTRLKQNATLWNKLENIRMVFLRWFINNFVIDFFLKFGHRILPYILMAQWTDRIIYSANLPVFIECRETCVHVQQYFIVNWILADHLHGFWYCYHFLFVSKTACK